MVIAYVGHARADRMSMSEDWDRGWLYWLRNYVRGFRFAKDAAQQMGIAESMLSRWVEGRRPTCESLLAVARRLGTNEVELLRLAGYITSDSEPSTLPPAKQRLTVLLHQPDIEVDEAVGEGMLRALLEAMRRTPT